MNKPDELRPDAPLPDVSLTSQNANRARQCLTKIAFNAARNMLYDVTDLPDGRFVDAFLTAVERRLEAEEAAAAPAAATPAIDIIALEEFAGQVRQYISPTSPDRAVTVRVGHLKLLLDTLLVLSRGHLERTRNTL